MSETIDGIVIVHFDTNGEPTYYVAGNGVRLFIVDERAPGDRIYEWLSRDDAETIKDILRDDPIGSSNDDRHAAIKHTIGRLLAGRRRLELVPDEKD